MTKYLSDPDPRYVSALAERYREWEQKGRGWTVWDFAVDLEPPFNPLKVEIGSNLPVFDDARLIGGRNQPLVRVLPGSSSLQVDPPKCFYRAENISELQILPSDGLDISPGVVAQFLLSLSSSKSPIALELIATSKQIVMQMACDRSFAPILQNQLKAFFPTAVVNEAQNGLSSLLFEKPSVVIADFGLGNNFLRSLVTFRSFSTDPLTGLITVMGSLLENERVVFQLLFQSCSGGWSNEIQRLRHDPAARDILSESNQAINEKLSSPLFAVVVRFAVQSSSLDRSWNILRNLGGNLSTFSNPSGNELIALSNDGLPTTNHLLSIKSRTSYRSGMLLSAAELAGLAHIPSENVQAEKLLRSNARTKEAPTIAAAGSLVLGVNHHNGRQTQVRLTADQRLKHLHLLGATGSGKSNELISCMLQDAAQNLGFACFDPHGDLIDMVMDRIPDHRLNDIILFDPSDEEFPIGFNIISANSELEKTLLSSDLVSIFRKFSTSWGDVMNSVLANAILAFLESTRGGSLLDLKRFLVDKNFRQEFLQTVLDEEIVYYWDREFPQIKGKPYGPLITRLDTFLRSKIIRSIVAQKENRLDFRRIMDTSKILLVRVAHGALGIENSYMLACLIVAKFYHAALSRQNVKESDRRPFFLYLDEAHNFVTESMTQILTGARKFGLGLITAHQQLRQFPPDILDSILGNSYTRICFRVDEDADRLAKGFSFFAAEDLRNLGVGQAICRVEQSQYDFNLETFPLNPVPQNVSERRRAAILEHSRAGYAKPRTEVENENRRGAPSSLTTIIAPVDPVTIVPSPRYERVDAKDINSGSGVSETGRGGRHHKELQAVIKRMAETNGFRAEIEKRVLEGTGSVDVSIENEDNKIAAEVCVTTTDYETNNAQKCLAAGYDYVVTVVSNQKKIPLIRAKLNAEIPAALSNKTKVCTPMDLLAFLRQLSGRHQSEQSSDKPKSQRLSFAEACTFFGKSSSTLYRWINEGRIPFYRVGREYEFDADELRLIGKHELSGKQKVLVKLEPLEIGKKKTSKRKKEQDGKFRKLLGLD
jgi:excisionase family DNA binding protein